MVQQEFSLILGICLNDVTVQAVVMLEKSKIVVIKQETLMQNFFSLSISLHKNSILQDPFKGMPVCGPFI